MRLSGTLPEQAANAPAEPAASTLPRARRVTSEVENQGLKLAIIGRTLAIALMAFWFVGTRAWPVAFYWAALLAAFAITGLIHYRLIGTRHDRWWLKYLIVTIDIVDIGILIALVPPLPVDGAPQILMFRFNPSPVFYVLLALSALSLSPFLLLWTGALSATTWMGSHLWIVSGMEQRLYWRDIPPDADAAGYLEILLSPNFVSGGSRFQETLYLLITTCLLALAVHRARIMVRRLVAAQEDGAFVASTLGQYVPETVARAIIADRGRLQPSRREATVLFADLDGFTAMAESMTPDAVIGMLNAFFAEVTQRIALHDGVVIGFTGDGFFATFNAPLDTPDHARRAMAAAAALQEMVRTRRFGGRDLTLRQGIATGPLAAGSVGGGGRQAYTVYGDPVNLASRLEQLNKTMGTNLLVAESTALALGVGYGITDLGLIPVRGLSQPIRVFTSTTTEAEATRAGVAPSLVT